MIKRVTFLGTLAGFGFLVGVISGSLSGAIAAEPHSENHANPSTPSVQFRRIEQPLSNKVAVTMGGLGLIGLELWWLLFSKPKSQKATAIGEIQEVTVTVDGGYEPSYIVVKAGQPVRLNFYRKDPSSCLEEIKLPDLHIAKELPLNQTTTIEFTPDRPGKYEFACGMNMFRGEIQVEEAASPPVESPEAVRMLEVSVTLSPDSRVPDRSASLTLESEIQKIAIHVNQGYSPNRIIVKAGQPVQLKFWRENPSHCLDQVLIPDFDVVADLPLNEVTTVELTPEVEGEYVFTCGMNMVRGVIEVQAANSSSPGSARRVQASNN